jgi:ribosome-associated toxin RatA of RatAB toxin-antitoxin module
MESFFHFGISAITEPFHVIILSLWDFSYHRVFSCNHSFTLGFQLSQNLLMESFFHIGISTITEPFHLIHHIWIS